MTDEPRSDTVSEVIDERIQVYGQPEVTFPQIAQLWSGYLGFEVRPTDVPIMQLLMKAVRLRQAPDYSDNSDDMEGYLDIFRKLVGDDMVHARSVDEYIAKKPAPAKPVAMGSMMFRPTMVDHYINGSYINGLKCACGLGPFDADQFIEHTREMERLA